VTQTGVLPIPLNDLGRYVSSIAPKLEAKAQLVILGGHFVLGPEVAAFEANFARFCGAPYCVGVANGTEGLELALRAVGVGVGDYVVVAANAGVYGTTALLAAGAVPVFADVDLASALLTPATLRDALSGNPTPKAVIVTHLYGRLADMQGLRAVAAQSGLAVIEDCSQAHGARDDTGRCAGAFGDVGVFSFYPTKNLGALGDGGAIVARNPDIHDRVRQLRQYGWSTKYTSVLPGGRNSRLDELQAALLNVALEDVDARNSRRREIANRYSREICNPAIATPPVSGAEFVAHLYVVATRDRQGLQAHLAAHLIASDVHFPVPEHRQPIFEGRFDAISLPNAETLCASVLSLPCFPELTDDEATRVVAACNSWQP
jgi:dTDP-4-amino-4,6-dideoxygalactose transaminase